MKIRCLLVDDEAPALEILQSYIANTNGIEVVGSCNNAVEAMDTLCERQVDLIFLDIKMPRLLGTNFVRNLPAPPKVIFVTAYRDYAAESYDLDAVDYLVKPVSFERFLKAISKVKRILGHEVSAQTEEYKRNPDAFIYLKVNRNMQKVLIADILYIESWKDYIKVFLSTGENFFAKQSIGSMENLLSDHRFTRVHRSYIVSVEKITGYNSSVIQLGSIAIPIGRLYKQNIMEIIRARSLG